MSDKRHETGSHRPRGDTTPYQEVGHRAPCQEEIALHTIWHSREAAEAILEASAFLADNAALYAISSSEPQHLLLVRQRGNDNPPSTSPNNPRRSLPYLALTSGQGQPAPLIPGTRAISLPLKHAQRTVAVLYLDRGGGIPFAPSDLAAAQALATVAGPLLHFEQLHLASHELAAQEERNRIAREIHDGVSQNLALLMLKMEIISRLADSDPSKMKMELRKVMSILELSVQELRRSLYTLRSPDPSRLGLVPALQRLVRDFEEQANVEVTFNAAGDLHLSPEVQSVIFSATQDRLDTLAKMGTASKVSLKLELADQQILVQITDNSQQAPSLPLAGEPLPSNWKERLLQRTSSVGGSVRVLSRPPTTRVQILIPRPLMPAPSQ